MRRIKLIFLPLLIFFINAAIAQTGNKTVPEGTYYVVRHAEKDTGNNPALTHAGYLRAGELYRTLKNKKISRIYVTQYRRTQLTGDSLRVYQKIDTIHYIADTTGNDLLKKLSVKRGKENNVLIIGHSNTIPAILEKLGVTALELISIPDDEFDDLFVVTIKNKKVSLKWLKYGRPPQKK